MQQNFFFINPLYNWQNNMLCICTDETTFFNISTAAYNMPVQIRGEQNPCLLRW